MRIPLLIFFTSSLLCFTPVWGQSPWSLRLNLEAHLLGRPLQIGPPAAMVQYFPDDHWRYGWELSRLELQNVQRTLSTTPGTTVADERRTQVAFRYQLEYLVGPAEWPLRPYAGGSVCSGLSDILSQPRTNNLFESQTSVLFADLSTLVGMQWPLHERVLGFFEAQANLARVEHSRSRVENPALPLRQQEFSQQGFLLLPSPRLTLRLGVSYAFGS